MLRHDCRLRPDVFAIFGNQNPFFVGLPYHRVLQIIEHDEISPVPRRNRTMISQPIMARGVDAAHLKGRDRIDPEPNSFSHRMIDVAFTHQIAR